MPKLTGFERACLDAFRRGDPWGLEAGDTADPSAWLRLCFSVALEAGRIVRGLRVSRLRDTVKFKPDGSQGRHRIVWMRLRGELPDDPSLHTAALVYASDRTLLGTARRGIKNSRMKQSMGASLDHAMWFHRWPRFDDWIIYSSESPVAHSARGLIFASMYTRDGTQIASVAQEGLIRFKK